LIEKKEIEILLDFCSLCLKDHKSGAIYLSGAAGTGKTSTVNLVLKMLQKFKYFTGTQILNFNCMNFTSPKAIFKKLGEELLGISTKVETVINKLDNFFSEHTNTVILVADEIDQLVTKDQDVLYKLFEWTQIPKSRVILIGIANSRDLMHRCLPRLQAKRCEPLFLNFLPYNKKQIEDIIKNRLIPFELPDKVPIIEHDAIELCARKISTSSGDLRKGLQIVQKSNRILYAYYFTSKNISNVKSNN